MEVTITGNTSKGIAYMLDWIQVTYQNKKGQNIELTLDVSGIANLNVKDNKFYYRINAVLMPWAEWDENGDEKNLEEMSEEEVSALYPRDRLLEIIKNSTDTVAGLYPFNKEDKDKAYDDIITECQVHFEDIDYDITLKCETESTLYD